jgi:hypothetical protein
MYRFKWWYELLPDARVYTWTTYPEEVYANTTLQQMYIYNDNDGLWASEVVRYFWRFHPSLHPYSTLFDILSENLDL